MTQSTFFADGGATFSPCRGYRYHLWRHISRERDAHGRCTFIMLNPSTADESQDDPTIRRCIGFARAWRCEFLDVLNIFAFRSTDPRALYDLDDPVGPDNDAWIRQAAIASTIIVAAWGAHGELHGRGDRVRAMLAASGKLHYLRLTKDGAPGHPLYLRADLRPVQWVPVMAPSKGKAKGAR